MRFMAKEISANTAAQGMVNTAHAYGPQGDDTAPATANRSSMGTGAILNLISSWPSATEVARKTA